MQWLDATVPEEGLLMTPPARLFTIERIGARPVQTALEL
jgi:hypothetical protein